MNRKGRGMGVAYINTLFQGGFIMQHAFRRIDNYSRIWEGFYDQKNLSPLIVVTVQPQPLSKPVNHGFVGAYNV